MEPKIVVILASTIREAKEIASQNHKGYMYHSVYKYSKGKGNNFYTFVKGQ